MSAFYEYVSTNGSSLSKTFPSHLNSIKSVPDSVNQAPINFGTDIRHLPLNVFYLTVIRQMRSHLRNNIIRDEMKQPYSALSEEDQ